MTEWSSERHYPEINGDRYDARSLLNISQLPGRSHSRPLVPNAQRIELICGPTEKVLSSAPALSRIGIHQSGFLGQSEVCCAVQVGLDCGDVGAKAPTIHLEIL